MVDMTSASAWAFHQEAMRRVSRAICADPSLPVDIAALCALAEMTPLHLEQAFFRCHGASIAEYARHEWNRQRSRGIARPWLIAAI